MKFMVNPAVWTDCSATIGPACLVLENWLNTSLVGATFGSNLDQVSFMVQSIEEDHEKSAIQAAAWDKLATYKHMILATPFRVLSFGISLPYDIAASLTEDQARSEIARLISGKIANRPKRVPKGLNYQKLSDSVQASMQVFTAAA